MRQIIEFIPIAKSIPEWSKRDEMLYSCAIGVSPQKGLMRLYPVPVNGVSLWRKYGVPVERNKLDSRKESYKMPCVARKEGWIGIEHEMDDKGYANKSSVLRYLRSCVSNSISELNAQRRSVGVILVDAVNAGWKPNNGFINTLQVGLFEEVELSNFVKYTKASRQYESRISFKDADGQHNLQLNDWSIYEGHRKLPYADPFRFYNDKGGLLLVGNMNAHRNNWIALKLLPIDKQQILL